METLKRYEILLCELLVPVLITGSALLNSRSFGQDFSLMIQSSPNNGGMIRSSAAGGDVIRAQANGSITLTATPMPGYQFVQWLGDVTDAVTAQTTVLIDGPKIVVAVFTRSDADEVKLDPSGATQQSSPSGGGGGSRGRAPGVAIAGPGNAGAGGFRTGSSGIPAFDTNGNATASDTNNPAEIIPSNETIGPDAGNSEDVPEPATVGLMGIGVFLLLAQRRLVKA